MAAPSVGIPKLAKGNVVTLKSLGIDEKYLENFIDADPTVLGLGDVIVIERQRRQEKAGRLDLLLQDDSGEVRYEVELMLGSVDESHLIRTVEYWDIERRRYPAYDHRAVIVAEDIATRFLNVITLFSGSIPIIAIQVNAISIDGKAGLTFVRLVDSTQLRKDDETQIAGVKATDRAYWDNRVGLEMMKLADQCLKYINEKAQTPRSMNYNKYFIGLTEDGRANNFVYFSPKQSFLKLVFQNLDPVEPWVKRLNEAGLDYKNLDGVLKVRVTAKDLSENAELIRQMLQTAVAEDEKE